MALFQTSSTTAPPDPLVKQKQLRKSPPLEDAFKQANNLVWKGLQLPCVGGGYSFTQGYTTHAYLYRDEAFIQSIGRENQRFRYTIPCRQGIVRKHTNAFSDIFPELLRLCLDRSEGELIDPFLGVFNAKVSQLQYDYEAATGRDGLDVHVEFISVPKEGQDATEPQFDLQVVASDMDALDRELDSVDWGTTEPPKPLVNPLHVVSNFADQALFSINKLGAELDQINFAASKTIDSLNALGDVENWQAVQACLRLKDTVLSSKKLVGSKGKRVRVFVVRNPTTLSQVAKVVSNTVADLIRMNPDLSRMPKIRPNTPVYYTIDG